jgi:hypothetical protein
MTSTAWLAQIPARSEAQRKADREKVARARESARKKMERSEELRETRSRGVAARSGGKQVR